MQIYFFLLLLTSNVSFQMGKCPLGVHIPQMETPSLKKLVHSLAEH